MKHFIAIAVILFATALPLAAQDDPNKPVDPTTDYIAMDAEKFEEVILDIGDGVSHIYYIDPGDLTGKEAKGLAQRMISILRSRIDPANMANIKLIPRGDTRIEIQLPLTDQAEPNTLPLTAEQIESTVLGIMAAHPEQFTHPAKTMTDDQFKRAVLGILSDHPEIFERNKPVGQTITPAQLETYEDKIISKVQSFYVVALTLLLVFIALFITLLGIAFEIWRKRTFTTEMAEQESKLQKDAEKKIIEATQKLYIGMAGNLASVYLGIASACKDSSYLRILSGIFAVDQTLVGMSADLSKDTLTWILTDIQSLNATDLNKEEWETLDKNIRMVERKPILTDYPEISGILAQIGQITSHHIIQLKKETDESDN